MSVNVFMLKWTNAYIPRSCHASWRGDGTGRSGAGDSTTSWSSGSFMVVVAGAGIDDSGASRMVTARAAWWPGMVSS